jgi:HlyD family secretion protein
MSTRKKILLGVGIVLIVAGIVGGVMWWRRTDDLIVNIEAIQRRDLEAVVSASGKIEPKRSVNISADTMGRVTSLAVNEGDTVARGQFLLQIDPKNLRSAVAAGEAGVLAARSSLEQLRVSTQTARENLNLARETLRRQQELWREGLTTKDALDHADNEVKVREKELQEREQAVKTQDLRIRQERAALDSARYDLSKVRIESPIDGIVTRRNIEEGETVVVGTMNNAGTVLLTIADMSVIEAEVEVDETDIPSVRLGQSAKVTIDALPDQTFTGQVTEIGNSPIQNTATQSGGETSTQATNFKVVVTLEGRIPGVRPGFTTTADITTATRENVVSVPIQATTVREMVVDARGQIVREPPTNGRRRQGGVEPSVAASELQPGQSRKELEGVFVVRDEHAVFLPVKTGIAGERYFEVVSGLQPGDRVIVGPFTSVRELSDGDPVKIEEPERTPIQR